MAWTGDLNFLNSGKHDWIGTLKDKSQISWRFSKYSDRLFPFPFYECRMTGWGMESFGFGVSRNETQAVQKSFGEAWERLWLNKLASEDVVRDQIKTSNGFAAGRTDQMALINSKNELIERAVMMKAWSEKTGWVRTKPRSVGNRFLVWGLRLKGWQTSLFDIKSNLGQVKACLIQHSRLGSIFDTSFVSDETTVEEKLLLSVIKNSYFQNPKDNFDLPENGGPDDHRDFYSVPKNNDAFVFLKGHGVCEATVKFSNEDRIKSKLVVCAGDFPAVAYSSNASWPAFCWGRHSIGGTNPWPHPLA